MTRTKLMTTTVAALFCGFATSATANLDLNDMCLDPDNDLSESSLDTAFRTIDTDGDGFITREEYDVCLSGVTAKAGPKNTQERMVEFDTDGDRQISREEYLAAGGTVLGASAGGATVATGQTSAESTATVESSTMSEPGDENQAGAAGASTEQGSSAGTAEENLGSSTSQTGLAGTTSEPGDENQAGAAGSAIGTEDQSDMAGAEGSSTGSVASDSSVSATDAEVRQYADELAGRDLVNSNGEEIGEIEDLVVDEQNNALYVIASVGGFLGIGDRKVAVPFEQLTVHEDDVMLTQPITKEELKQMPAYEDGTWRSLKNN